MKNSEIKAPVTSSFVAARKRALLGARVPAALMADGAVAAYRSGMQLRTDAGDTTQGSHAWSPPA